MSNKFLFTSEQVSEGHPDKMCDQVSDAVLDAIYEQDRFAKVAIETLIKNNTVIVAGEVTTVATVDYDAVTRKALANIGFDNEETGFDHKTANINLLIYTQSREIAEAVDKEGDDEADIGAGDQGLMIGYATNESPELLPLTMVWATNLLLELKKARISGHIPWLMPDAKSQVTIEYEKDDKGNLKINRLHTVLISTQHRDGISNEEIKNTLIKEIVNKVIPAKYYDAQTRYFINPSGSFVVGGPKGDCGVTGRKIIADSYGGWGGHGGGAFSGKDPTKVDRSAAYAARWIAKSLVYNEYCNRCTVQITYGIGITHPISVFVDTHGTVLKGLTDNDLVELVFKHFDLRPGMIIKHLNLRRPIYRRICVYNHFMPKDDATWEIPKIF
jgi:S-adenosylmethionine synthetase